MERRKKYAQNLDVAWRAVDGEAVLIDPDGGQMLVLNAVGSRVWQWCETPREAGELAVLLAAEFEVDEKQAAADAAAFLSLMCEKGLMAEVE